MSFPGNPPGCDSPTPASRIGDVCRCLVCSRCGHHTGNSNYGHAGTYCSVTGTLREFHICCPGNCELENPDVIAWTPTRERLFRAIKRGFVVEHGTAVYNTVTGRKVNATVTELVAARLAKFEPKVNNRAPVTLTEAGEAWLDTYGKNGETP